MWMFFACLIALFDYGKGICEGECKIDTCTSRTASIFVWKLISSGSKEGTFCRKDDSCVWIFQRKICQELENLDATAFKKSSKIYECYNMTKKEHLLVRRNAVIKLSKLRNTVGVIIFLPYFGMAIVLLLIIIWIHEEAENVWTICKYRHISGYLNRKKLLKTSQTMIRFDDCDACIKTISSSFEETKCKENTSINDVNGQHMENGSRIINLDELDESNKRIKEMSYSSYKLANSIEIDLQVPKLVTDTQDNNSKQALLVTNNSTEFSTTYEDKYIEDPSEALTQPSQVSRAYSERSLTESYCKECNVRILKCDDKALQQKTEKVTKISMRVKAGGREESKKEILKDKSLYQKTLKVNDMEGEAVSEVKKCHEIQLEKKPGSRKDVRLGNERKFQQAVTSFPKTSVNDATPRLKNILNACSILKLI